MTAGSQLPWTARFAADHHPATLSSIIRWLALDSGLSERAALEVATAASELITNSQKSAGGGTVTLRLVALPFQIQMLEVVVEDDGPGFDDIKAAIQDGFSEGAPLPPEWHPNKRGLGVGLGGVKRLMDTFEAGNRPQGGARVVVRKRITVGRDRRKW